MKTWEYRNDLTVSRGDMMTWYYEEKSRAVVKKYAGRWEVEVLIPTDDFGKLAPTRQYPWRLNICRTRVVDHSVRNTQSSAIAPIGGAYKTQKYWARIWNR